jgi:hypothetical protein
MTHLVQVDCAAEVNGHELLAVFEANGLRGEVVDGGPTLVFRLADAGRDAGQFAKAVVHSLDSWLADHRSPLVPAHVAEDRFALRPPAA